MPKTTIRYVRGKAVKVNPYRQNKYKAKKTTVFTGGKKRKYDSRLESQFGVMLHEAVKDGLIKSVKDQHRIKIGVAGTIVCTHIVDFLVTLNDGKEVFVEAKGFKTDVWILKKKLVMALFPDTPYLVNPSLLEVLDA